MDCEVWTTCCDSEDDTNEEAGAAGTGNISQGNAPPDIKPPAMKKRKIEAVKQDPVTQGNSVKPAKAFQGETSSASFFSPVLNLRGSEVQKKKQKKNLIKNGQGQAPNLVKESKRPQKSPVPNTSQARLNQSSKISLLSIKQQLSYYAHMAKQRTEHTGVAANHCTACNETFKTPSGLKLHRHKAHSTENTFKCPECEKSFLSPGSVTQHCNAMHNHLNQSSPTAVKQFLSNYTNMAKPPVGLPPTGVAANHCTACTMTFKTPAGLKQHRQKAHNTENTFKCPECEKFFPSPGSVTQHRSAMHNDVKKSSQTAVKQSLSLSSNMAKYQAVPTGVAASHCTECNKTFKSPAHLNRHRHWTHSSEGTVGDTFRCPECDKLFLGPGSVTQHRIVMHDVRNIYQCSICNIIAKSAATLNQHHRITHS